MTVVDKKLETGREATLAACQDRVAFFLLQSVKYSRYGTKEEGRKDSSRSPTHDRWGEMATARLLAFVYLPLSVALVTFALIAAWRLRRHPRRYSYAFPAERTRRHFTAGSNIIIIGVAAAAVAVTARNDRSLLLLALAGCLLTVVLVVPVAIRIVDSRLLLASVFVYAAGVVPLVTGILGSEWPLAATTVTTTMLSRALAAAARLKTAVVESIIYVILNGCLLVGDLFWTGKGLVLIHTVRRSEARRRQQLNSLLPPASSQLVLCLLVERSHFTVAEHGWFNAVVVAIGLACREKWGMTDPAVGVFLGYYLVAKHRGTCFLIVAVVFYDFLAVLSRMDQDDFGEHWPVRYGSSRVCALSGGPRKIPNNFVSGCSGTSTSARSVVSRPIPCPCG